MRNLLTKKLSLVALLACISFSSIDALAHSGLNLGELWKTLTGKPTGKYKCQKNQKLIGLANESYSSVKLFFFFYNAKGKKETKREMKIGQRGNIKLNSGQILLVCTNYSLFAVSTEPNKQGDSAKRFTRACKDSSSDKCYVKPMNNHVYTFKEEARIVGSGDFKSHSERAERWKLFKFPRYITVNSK